MRSASSEILDMRRQLPLDAPKGFVPRCFRSFMGSPMASPVELAELSQWFEKSVVANYRLFFSIAYQILLDTHEAEEAAQDAVLKGWSHLGELNDPAALVGWI